MSQRKILQAKRHAFKVKTQSVQRPIPINTLNQGVKRNHEFEQSELPPSKRINRNSIQIQRHPTQYPSKNLAERRMQNLRNSLETQRRISEGFQSESSSGSTKSIKKIASNFTPISNRLKPKIERNYQSPSPLHIPNTRTNINLPDKNAAHEEEMEWDEINDTTVVNKIIDIRKEINYQRELSTATDVDSVTPLTSDGVFVVVDTNIFLSQLTILSNLKETNFPEFGRVTIFVPWMVIQELDYMKEFHNSKSIMTAARRAIHYINTNLANKNPNFTGQSVMDAAKLEFSSSNPDDGIVFSCIQLKDKGKFVILLSNDVNLCNKMLINKVQAYNSSDIINKLNDLKINESILNPSKQIKKVGILLSNLLTHIIENEMSEAYGNIWQNMINIKPPFTTEEALNCIMKYWISVFSFSLHKQCKLKVTEFIQFLKQHRNDASYNSSDFNKLVEYSLSVCIYLKNGYSKYRNLVVDCIGSIQKCIEM